MDHLDDITVDELHEALDTVEGKKPVQRLLAAIAYKNGVTQTELAEWHDTGRRTVYNWLMRLDCDEALERAVTDDKKSGRNRKLSKLELDEFRKTVRERPTALGYEEPSWTTQLVRSHLEERYGVEYSIPSCRRLLKEAGLSYEKPRSADFDVETEGSNRFDVDPQNRGGWVPQ